MRDQEGAERPHRLASAGQYLQPAHHAPHHRPARIAAERGGRIEAETNYALYQTDVEGVSRLFAVGCYRDTIGFFDGALKFVDRLVVLDTFSIPTLLAKPV